MTSFLEKNALNYILPIFILAVSMLIFLPHLGRNSLWQDEAQTALISRSILTNGIPYNHDTRNSFSQELGVEGGVGNAYKWHPWIPYYIHAAFFQLFGQSDFIARLPDALFGIGTVLLCFWTVRSTGKGPRASLVAAGILMFMIPFLLLSRQCRYYSMAAFFSMGCILTYFLFLQSKKYARILFMSSTIILFHVQMIYGAIVLATVLLHLTLAGKEYFKRLWASIVGISCFVLPWMIYISDVPYKARYSHVLSNPLFIKNLFFDFLGHIGNYVVPIYFLIFLLIVVVWFRNNLRTVWSNTKLSMSFYFIFLEIMLITLSLTAPDPHFRYLVPVLPICAIVVAEIIEWGFQAHPMLGCIGLFIILLHQPLADYYYELTHDFKGPIEGLVGHLRQNAQPTDTIAITYGDMPVKWYTGLHVIGGLAGDTMEGVHHARWIVIRKYMICMQDLIVANNLYAQLHAGQYRKIVLDAPDTPFENREDPKLHLYRTATGEDRVVIYERMP